MRMISILKNLRSSVAAFQRNDRGNIAVIFAITMVPMIGLIGAAVDYSRAVNARTAMQTALDTAALMISKDASSLSASQISTKAQAYFSALYNHPEATNVSITAAYTPSAGGTPAKVVMTGSAKMATDFMKVAGYPSLDLGVSSTTTWGSTKMRVAMALDVTGSMDSAGKMAAMQSAAKDLITKLSASSSSNGDVMISIVPFATHVNIGTSFKNALYMDWSQWSPSGSVMEGKTCSVAGGGGGWGGWGGWGGGWGGGGNTMTCGNLLNNVNQWNGCVTDRAQPYDTQSDVPALLPLGTMLTADQSSYCPEELMPLSYNWTQLKQKIDDLTPSGATNQPIGLHWAWFSLLSQTPLNAPAKASGVVFTDVIILMSDGQNTMDRWYGDGANYASEVDARQAILCANVKASGVKIYTIQVNTDNDPESAILKSCASDGQFWATTTASGIATAFDAIGASLTKLRVAK